MTDRVTTNQPGKPWDQPDPALKRMAEAKLPEQFKTCVNCGHRHMFLPGCSEACECMKERLG